MNFLEKTEKISQIKKTGKILLVEDDQTLLELIASTLQKIGFQAIGTDKPSEAIEIVKNNPDKIQVLLTDMVMPEMNGIQLANNIRKIQPQIKCLFMSGYPGKVFEELEEEKLKLEFLQKPFSMHTLENKIYDLLSE